MEHFDAAMVSASSPLAAVMGDVIALMAVMRLDVVSDQTVWGRHGNIYTVIMVSDCKVCRRVRWEYRL